jgi:hypothetical protein
MLTMYKDLRSVHVFLRKPEKYLLVTAITPLRIANCDWANIINGADTVDIATDNFTTECIPEKIITIRPRDKPWYVSMIRKTIRLRDRLRNKALKRKKDSDWTAYRKLRNSVNNMKKHAISITTILRPISTTQVKTILSYIGS